MTIHTIETPSERKYQAWRTDELRRLQELKAQGMQVRDIAVELGRTFWGVRAQMDRLGLIRRVPGRVSMSKANEALFRDEVEALIERWVGITGNPRVKVAAAIRRRTR
jgi:hypothetical protein